jgi:transketolase
MDAIWSLAQRDARVVFIGSDIGCGVLDEMRRVAPDRFFMEGVSEAHVIGMAAGLAMDGFIPYVNTIATFLTRRCFEQIAIDLCLHNLPVRLIGSGGGAVYAPLGPTHMALDDVAILRALPNMTIVAPCDAPEMQRLMDASLDWPGPLYVRVAKGGDPVISSCNDAAFQIGTSILMREPGDVLIVSTGVMTARVLAAADALASDGIDCGVLHMHTLKPLDAHAFLALASRVRLVVTVEEHLRNGGLGSAIAETLADAGVPVGLQRLALGDAFISAYGSQEEVLEAAGLTPVGIAGIVRRCIAGIPARVFS